MQVCLALLHPAHVWHRSHAERGSRAAIESCVITSSSLGSYRINPIMSGQSAVLLFLAMSDRRQTPLTSVPGDSSSDRATQVLPEVPYVAQGKPAAASTAAPAPARREVHVLPSVDAAGRAAPGAFGRDQAGHDAPQPGASP